jgi:hypothetical protein
VPAPERPRIGDRGTAPAPIARPLRPFTPRYPSRRYAPWPSPGRLPEVETDHLRDALPQYVAYRRAMGTKLQEPARTLVDFVTFMECERAAFITTELALRWAMKLQGVQRANWGRRLTMVRRFAVLLSTIAPSTAGRRCRLDACLQWRSPVR